MGLAGMSSDGRRAWSVGRAVGLNRVLPVEHDPNSDAEARPDSCQPRAGQNSFLTSAADNGEPDQPLEFAVPVFSDRPRHRARIQRPQNKSSPGLRRYARDNGVKRLLNVVGLRLNPRDVIGILVHPNVAVAGTRLYCAAGSAGFGEGALDRSSQPRLPSGALRRRRGLHRVIYHRLGE